MTKWKISRSIVRANKFLLKLHDIHPSVLLVGGLLFALTIIFISKVLHLDEYNYNGIEVGFISSVSWVALLIITPLIMVFLSNIRNELKRLPNKLQHNNMFIDCKLNILGKERTKVLRRDFNRRLRKATLYVVILAVLCFIGSIIIWYIQSAGPLIFQYEPENNEYQWLVKALDHLVKYNVLGGRLVNGLFSLGAFLIIGFLAWMLCYFLVLMICFRTLLKDYSTYEVESDCRERCCSNKSHERLMIVPNLRGDDNRYGLDVFGRMNINSLMICLSAFVVFYFARIWDILLSNDKDLKFASVMSFISNNADDLYKVAKGLFSEQPQDLNLLFNVYSFERYQSYIPIAAMFIIAICLWYVNVYTIIMINGDNKNWLSSELKNRGPDYIFQGIQRDEAIRRLNTMSSVTLKGFNAPQVSMPYVLCVIFLLYVKMVMVLVVFTIVIMLMVILHSIYSLVKAILSYKTATESGNA